MFSKNFLLRCSLFSSYRPCTILCAYCMHHDKATFLDEYSVSIPNHPIFIVLWCPSRLNPLIQCLLICKWYAPILAFALHADQMVNVPAGLQRRCTVNCHVTKRFSRFQWFLVVACVDMPWVVELLMYRPIVAPWPSSPIYGLRLFYSS
jgi:hypothetical protein